MIDLTVKFFDVYMIFEDLSKTPEFKLPEGFSFRFFREGDERDWMKIEVSSGDIKNLDTAKTKFDRDYKDNLEEVKKNDICFG